MRDGRPDFEAVRSHAGLSFVSIVAISAAVDEIRRFAEAGDPRPDLVQRLGPYGGQQWQRKLHNFLRDIARIRLFAASWSGFDNDEEALCRVRRFDAVDWWEPRHDLALIFAMSEFGQLVVASWIVDAARPFREFIPGELLEDFEKAAERERDTRRVCKPKELGGLGFLFKDKIRMSRALSVVRFIENLRDRRPSPPPPAPPRPPFSLPYQLSPQMTLLSLGRYASAQSQFPAGYTVRLTYMSPLNPREQVAYEAIISYDERFHVRMLVEPYLMFAGDGINSPWEQIYLAAERAAEAAGIPFTAFRPNGSSMLGLGHPVVVEQLARMKQGPASSLPVPLLGPPAPPAHPAPPPPPAPPRLAQFVIPPALPRVEVPPVAFVAGSMDEFGIGALMNDHSHERRPMTTVYSRKVSPRPVGDEY
jgi:hypothetical protein